MIGANIAGLYITDEYVDVLVGYCPPKSNEVEVDEGWNTRLYFDRTEKPGDVLKRVVQWINAIPGTSIKAVAAGAYGPFVSIKEGTPGWGVLQKTGYGRPWSEVSISKELREAFHKVQGSAPPFLKVVPDVACAALGEARARGAHISEDPNDLDVTVFIKVSFGIGGAICLNGSPYFGRLHSEMGRVSARHWVDKKRDPEGRERLFEGLPRNRGTVEGLASVPAIEKRFEERFEDLKRQPDHAAWYREAWYLANLCRDITVMVAPSRIILGGRVMSVPHVLVKVQREFRKLVKQTSPLYEELAPDFIGREVGATAGRAGRPGMTGALYLAQAGLNAPPPKPRSVLRRTGG